MENVKEIKGLMDYLGEELLEIMLGHRAFIAGGAIRSIFCNEDINDIDVYVRSQEDAIKICKKLYKSSYFGNNVISHSDKATMFNFNGVKVQVIYFKYFNTPYEIFNSFDFTAVMGALDVQHLKLELHDDFLKSNLQKRLTFNEGTYYPLASAARVLKYINKGYSISGAQFMKIILMCANTDISDRDKLTDAVGGAYGLEAMEGLEMISNVDSIRNSNISISDIEKSIRKGEN